MSDPWLEGIKQKQAMVETPTLGGQMPHPSIELETARKRIAALEAEWRRECDDADKIIEKLGLTVEQARTEGGSLKVVFICNHIQETLDALADTEARRIALFNENAELRRSVNALQAHIDQLMWEHCPEEMTREQIDNYAKHQRPVDAETEAAIDAALGEKPSAAEQQPPKETGE